MKTGTRRAATGIGGAVILALAAAGPAVAAGTGYGPTPPPSGTPAGGFTSVVTARTVGHRGGAFKVAAPSGTIRVVVPRGAWRNNTQVVITKGTSAKLRSSLPKALRKDRVLAAFGVQLKQGSANATASKNLTVTFLAKSLKPGDIVVIFNPKTRTFTRAHTRVRKGEVVVQLKRSQSIGVLAPPAKRAPAHKRKRASRKGVISDINLLKLLFGTRLFTL